MAKTARHVDDSTILELTARIYDAAMDASRWQDFLDALGTLYPDSGRVLWYEDNGRADVAVLSASGFEETLLTQYGEYYAALNPWTDVGLCQPAGFIHTTDMLIPDRRLIQTEFYADWLRPQGLRNGFGTSVVNDGGRIMFFSVLQPGSRSPGEAERDLCRRLLPHLQKAAAIHEHCAGLRARAESLERLANRLTAALLLVQEDGRIGFMNQAGETLLRDEDGLFLHCGFLRARHRWEDARLRRAITAALGTAGAEPSDGGEQMLVTRPSGRRPFSVLVTPVFPADIGTTSPLAQEAPAAAIFIADPEADIAASVAAVGRAYGLTRAEIQLLGALLTEGSLTRAAHKSGITHETARSELKHVFAKTGARSQAELVRTMLLSIPAQGPASGHPP